MGRKLKKNKTNTGLTLVELIVTIGIFVLITGIAVANYPEFNSRISVGKVAREIALTIRQAQAYGLAVQEREEGVPLPSAYGIFIKIKDDPQKIILFADLNDNKRYDEGGGCGFANTECVEKFTMKGGVVSYDLCVINEALWQSEPQCWTDGNNNSGGKPTRRLDILFERATPDAYITRNTQGKTPNDAGYIKLTSERHPDQKKAIRVWVTGQISVEDINE